MKKMVMVIGLSILLVAGSVDFGLSQITSEVELKKPKAEVGWAFNNGRIYLDLGVQSGYLKGDTTYRITFLEGASELEFPLKAYLFGPEISWGYKNSQKQDKLQVKFKWLNNISRNSGKMKDSDWIEGDGQPGLDIYSESDIELKAYIIDVNAIYNFWPIKQLSIGPMVGYKYQRFEYDVKNTKQIGIGIYAPDYTASVSGRTLDYEVVYHIPYFGLGSNILFGKKFRVNMTGGYTPWATAKDRDDHILRYKLSEADVEGYTYFASLNAILNFLPHWFLIISGEYMKIHTTGTQHQSFYAGPYVGWTADVDDKITSKQRFLSAMITYRF
jgi:outer membrane protease